MAIFHSYVSLPEGKPPFSYGFPMVFPLKPPFSYGFPMVLPEGSGFFIYKSSFYGTGQAWPRSGSVGGPAAPTAGPPMGPMG